MDKRVKQTKAIQGRALGNNWAINQVKGQVFLISEGRGFSISKGRGERVLSVESGKRKGNDKMSYIRVIQAQRDGSSPNFGSRQEKLSDFSIRPRGTDNPPNLIFCSTITHKHSQRDGNDKSTPSNSSRQFLTCLEWKRALLCVRNFLGRNGSGKRRALP